MAMCARKDLWEALKKKRAAAREEMSNTDFVMFRGKTVRDAENDERQMIARHQIPQRLKELDRGAIVTR